MPAAFGLHKSMFLKTLANQTTDEQRELFYEPAKRYEIIGCYAQTELGHGSNVQGLETTATYQPSTKVRFFLPLPRDLVDFDVWFSSVVYCELPRLDSCEILDRRLGKDCRQCCSYGTAPHARRKGWKTSFERSTRILRSCQGS